MRKQSRSAWLRKENRMSATDERINPETERKHMESDLDAMLVCAYDDKRSSSKTVAGSGFA